MIIRQNTVWTAGSKISLTESIEVAPDATLTIEPGVRIEGNGHKIIVYGSVSATGTLDNPVFLTSAPLSFGRLADVRPSIHIDHAVIVGRSLESLSSGGTLVLSNSTLESADVGLVYPAGESKIYNNMFVKSVIRMDLVPSSDRASILIEKNYFVGGGIGVIRADEGAAIDSRDNLFLGRSGSKISIGGEGTINSLRDYFGVSTIEQVNDLILDRHDTLASTGIVNLEDVQFSLPSWAPLEIRSARDIDIGEMYFKNATLLGSDRANIAGNDFDNILIGNSGFNMFSPRLGRDTMEGMGGGDWYYVNSTDDVVIERPGEGYDAVLVSQASSYRLQAGQEIEKLAIESSMMDLIYEDENGTRNVDLFGNEFSQVIVGNDGINRIDGGGGADTLYGLGGNDTYFVDHASDRIIEAVGEGLDTVVTTVGYKLAAGQQIEVLQTADASGTTDLQLTGNEFANTLIGNAGANLLDGGGGIDEMRGGGGNDTYIVDHAQDIVFEAAGQGRDTVVTTVSYRLAAGQQIEVLQAADAKSKVALRLTGNEFVNTLVGNAGDNVLDGGLGADTMSGGAGNDTYFVDNARDVVVEGRNQGTDSVVASVSYTLADNVERLTLSGSKAINATGNALANHLVGNGAANVLDGKGGADTMEGGAGNDVYFVDHASDRVIEAVGGGRDTVVTTVGYRLAAGQQIETLQAADVNGKAALKLTGNEFTNKLIGNAGDNMLDGGAGIDEMRGGAGNDTYIVDHAKDVVVEAVRGGADTVLASVGYALKAGQEIESLRLTGTAGSVNLTGNEFGQSLTGNVGANVLDGGLGADVLAGGKGADTFVFSTKLGADNVDRITDFTAADTIRLSKSIFSALAPGELKANAFKDIAGAKVDADDHILYDSRDGSLFYDADGSGKAAAVKFAVLDNKAAITHADFVV